MKIDVELQNKLVGILTGLRNDRLPFWNMWRDIAEFYIPKRYTWLMSDKERKQYLQTNSSILDSTGTTAGKVLAAGMMNGITSPSRPWFKLRLRDFADSMDYAARRWLDEVRVRDDAARHRVGTDGREGVREARSARRDGDGRGIARRLHLPGDLARAGAESRRDRERRGHPLVRRHGRAG